ncbi:putative pectin lyase precursor [Auriculariales sp. MPI-PUGE-AT-0066]|nr:putative pectin lyase precursor [Auriculariales sp. MPI-PUGE-AT-0066]
MLLAFPSVLVALAYATGTFAVAASGTAFGFATGTTGGGSAAAVTPTSLAQVVSVLSDTTTRVINLDRIWDFTTYYGTVTGQYCKPWTCSPNPQYLLNSVSGCGSNTLYTATYYKAGSETSLSVGSNKTIRGIGSNAGLKGIGLRIDGQTNVIVQNLRITDLNHQYVWGGDGISVFGSSQIWIDHNYIARVGRQFVTIAYNPLSVTLSNNYFDGTATYSTGCDGYHYWAFIMDGVNSQITFAQNYVYHTAGRGPHTGGTSGNKQYIHAYNNLWQNVKGHAFDVDTGSNVLLEGNQFVNVTTVDTGNTNGNMYYVDTVAQADTPCTSTLGRTCEWNKYSSSGSLPLTRQATAVLTALKAYSNVNSYKPFGVTDVTAYVTANAGTGKV